MPIERIPVGALSIIISPPVTDYIIQSSQIPNKLPSMPYDTLKAMIIAVDVGGTKTLVVPLDAKGRMAESVIKIATPKDPGVFLEELKKLLSAFDAHSITAITIGIPGIVDNNGTILRCGNLPWKNFALKEILSEDWSCPIFVQNDAKLAGLAETNALKEIPALSLYITIGTGIGSGIITHGKLDVALSMSEAGHMVFRTPDGPETWESFASGHAITKRLGHEAHEVTDEREWQRIAEDVAIGLMALIPALQPDTVIIGGGIGLYFEQYSQHLRQILKKNIPEFINLPLIKQAVHPYEAVLYGCYYYAIHQRKTS
jgi:glucokinase